MKTRDTTDEEKVTLSRKNINKKFGHCVFITFFDKLKKKI